MVSHFCFIANIFANDFMLNSFHDSILMMLTTGFETFFCNTLLFDEFLWLGWWKCWVHMSGQFIWFIYLKKTHNLHKTQIYFNHYKKHTTISFNDMILHNPKWSRFVHIYFISEFSSLRFSHNSCRSIQ